MRVEVGEILSSSNLSLMAPKSIFRTLPSDGSVSTKSLEATLESVGQWCLEDDSQSELFILVQSIKLLQSLNPFSIAAKADELDADLTSEKLRLRNAVD